MSQSPAFNDRGRVNQRGYICAGFPQPQKLSWLFADIRPKKRRLGDVLHNHAHQSAQLVGKILKVHQSRRFRVASNSLRIFMAALAQVHFCLVEQTDIFAVGPENERRRPRSGCTQGCAP